MPTHSRRNRIRTHRRQRVSEPQPAERSRARRSIHLRNARAVLSRRNRIHSRPSHSRIHPRMRQARFRARRSIHLRNARADPSRRNRNRIRPSHSRIRPRMQQARFRVRRSIRRHQRNRRLSRVPHGDPSNQRRAPKDTPGTRRAHRDCPNRRSQSRRDAVL